MASAKDTFESATFLSNSFACGTWRGIGSAVVTPDADEFYAAKGITGFSAAVRGLENANFDLRGITSASFAVKGDQ